MFAVILTFAFISAEMSVDGFREPIMTNASSATTDEMHNSSMLFNESGEIFPPNETSFRDGGRLGYACDSDICSSVCCASGKAQPDGSCIEDNATFSIFDLFGTSVNNEEVTTGRVHYDPCDVNWMMTSVLRDFNVSSNGSIYARDFDGGSFFDFEHHCLFWEPNSEVYLAKVCYPWIKLIYWQTTSVIFVMVVMLAIFISYSVVPELKNLHGLVFRSYLASHIATNISMLGQVLTADSKTHAHLFIFFVFSLHYAAGSCALWFNVMCFNIWRTFRGLRSVDNNSRDHERKKYITYAIYAWVTPAVFHATTIAISLYVPYFRKLPLNNTLVLWSCAALLAMVVVCNSILYCATAIKIRIHQKETSHLANGVNKHHEAERQWFNLYVKLFVITGAHTITWIAWELRQTLLNAIVMSVVEVVQCILLFVIFVCKDNVKRSLRQRCENTMSRLQFTFGKSQTG